MAASFRLLKNLFNKEAKYKKLKIFIFGVIASFSTIFFEKQDLKFLNILIYMRAFDAGFNLLKKYLLNLNINLTNK